MEIIYPQNPVFYVALGSVIILFLLILISFFSSKKKKNLKSSLDMALFSIRLPKYEKNEGEKGDPKLAIGKMEQIFSNFLYFEDKSLNSSLFGSKQRAVLEIASEFGGTDISFYIAVPNSYAGVLPKYIEGAYPGAIVEKIPNDYTIFEPEASVATSFLRLKKTFFLPINTYGNLNTDPLEAITNSLTNIESNEGAAIQIIVRPVAGDLKSKGNQIISQITTEGKSFESAIASASQGAVSAFFESFKESKDNSQNPIKERKVDEATIEALNSKIKKPLFEVNIRLVASAKLSTRADELLQNMESSFAQFYSPFNNFSSVKVKGKNARKLIYNYIFRNFEQSQKIILNSEELTSIYHLPLSHMESPNIKWAGTKEVEPPTTLPQTGPILLGKSVFRSQEKDVYIGTREDRRRHLYIVGQTGVGKSAFLREMIRQDILNGEGVGVVDPHGELIEDILSYFKAAEFNDLELIKEIFLKKKQIRY